MKKVLIIINHLQFQDGVAKCAVEMANALSRSNEAEVTLCPLYKFDKNVLDNLDKEIIVKPVFKHYFRGLDRMIGLLPTKLLRKAIIKEHYDIEIGYCMIVPIQIVASYDSFSQTAVKHFAWMHGYDEGLSMKNEYKKMDKVFCVSKSNADRLAEECDNSFSVGYCYNLIDEKKLVTLSKEECSVNRDSSVPLFVTVGRLSPEKGYSRLLDVCKTLYDEGYVFRLWIIGNGPQEEELKKKAASYGLNNTITFWGKQNNPHAFTAKADVYLCSSLSEGFSTSCTEAILLGVPVITTDVSGGREIVDQSEVGLVVDNNETGLYFGMREVLDSPEVIKIWKMKLQQTKSNFSFSSRAQKIYNELEIL